MNSDTRNGVFSLRSLLWLSFVVAAYFGGLVTTRLSLYQYINHFNGRNGGGSFHFQGQNLANADFSNSKMSDSCFDGADLRNADLSNSVASCSSFHSCDLRGAELQCGVFAGANFTNADLRNARLDGSVLVGANFSGARIEGARLTSTTIIGNSSTFDSTTTYDADTLFPEEFDPVACGLTFAKDTTN